MDKRFIWLMFSSIFLMSSPAFSQSSQFEEFALIGVENVNQLQRVFTFQIEQLDEEAVSGLTWSPDSSLLAVGIGYGVNLFNSADFSAAPKLLETEEWVGHIVFIPNSNRFALAGEAYETDTLEKIDTLLDRDTVFSPDGQMLAYSTDNDIYLYNRNTGDKIEIYHLSDVTCFEGYYCGAHLTFSPDNQKLAFSFYDDNYELRKAIIHIPTGRRIETSESADGIFYLRFSPDSEMLTYFTGRPGYVGSDALIFSDGETGENFASIDGFAEDYSLNADGRLVVVGSANFQEAPNLYEAWGLVQFFDIGEVLKAGEADHDLSLFTLELPRRARVSQFSPDGKLLVTVDTTHNVTIWGVPIRE
jgi:WD40 repeat protein